MKQEKEIKQATAAAAQTASQNSSPKLETILSTTIPDLKTKVEILRQNDSFIVRVEDSEKTVEAVVSKVLQKKDYRKFVSSLAEDPEYAASIVVKQISKPEIADEVQFDAVEAGKDLLRDYLLEIAKYPRLKKEQVTELAKRIEQGDKKALETLVNSNLLLVIGVAKKYQRPGIDIFDLIQQGNEGIVIAAKKYNWRRNVMFSTYAYSWIKQRIKIYVRKRYLVAPQTYAKWNKLRQIEQEISQENNGDPPARHQFLKKIKGIFTEKELDFYLAKKSFNLVSYDSENFFEPGIETKPEEITDAVVELEHAMSLLKPNENMILRMRYGFPPYSRAYIFREIGYKLNMSKQRVQQVTKHAEQKIRSYFEEHKKFTK